MTQEGRMKNFFLESWIFPKIRNKRLIDYYGYLYTGIINILGYNSSDRLDHAKASKKYCLDEEMTRATKFDEGQKSTSRDITQGVDVKYLVSSIFILLFILIVDSPLLAKLIAPEQLLASIHDEYMFMEMIINIQKMILNNDLVGLTRLGLHFGYGSLFWSLYAIIGLPFSLYSFAAQVFALRLLSSVLKCGSILLLFTVLYEKSWAYAMLGVAFLMTLPGFYFYGKVISPTYLQMFLLTLSLFYLFKREEPSLEQFMSSLIPAICSVFVLINSSVFLIPLGIYALYKYRGQTTRKIVIKYSCVLAVITALSNILVLSTEGLQKTIVDFSVISTWTRPTRLSNLKDWYVFKGITWDGIILEGIQHGYLNIFGLTFITSAVVWSFIQHKDTKSALFFTTGAVLIFFTALKMPHGPWYMMNPMYYTLFIALYAISKLRWNIPIMCALFLFSLSTNLSYIVYKIGHRDSMNKIISKNTLLSNEIHEYLVAHGLANKNILIDHYIPLRTNGNITSIGYYGIGRFVNIDQAKEHLSLVDLVLVNKEKKYSTIQSETKIMMIINSKSGLFQRYKEFPESVLYKNNLSFGTREPIFPNPQEILEPWRKPIFPD